jgi:hypothetical protein
MKLYRGNANWLYHQLKLKYVEVYSNDVGIMPFEKFRDKIESGLELNFAGCSFKSSEKYSISMNTKNFTTFSAS